MPDYDLFLSYSHADKELADALVSGLEQEGLRVWIDTFEIEFGDSITEQINAGLAQSRYGLVLISPAYLQSQWAKTELFAFFKKQMTFGNKQLIPIWHKISLQDMLTYLPMQADFKALLIEDVSAVPQAVQEITGVVTRASRKRNRKRGRDTPFPTDTADDKTSSLLEQGKLLVEQGQIAEAISFIRQHLELKAPTKTILSSLSARFHQMERSQQQGVLSNENSQLEYNKIVKALLEILSS
ncbi:MAG: TIR domain-containing protein [Bacteroidota bacterium]